MKKLLLPLAALLSIFLLAAVNGNFIARSTERWQAQISQAEAWAVQTQWDKAITILEASYRDWESAQGFLHIVLEHDAVDNAEAMYHRAIAFALAEEPSEFRAETAHLRTQLHLLAEMEKFSIKNVL